MTYFVAFVDEVLTAIREQVAEHTPERGGALLGPVGQPVVTQFLFDPDATTSGSTYRPSDQLAERVRRMEQVNPSVEFKGILHSHPGSFNQPSGGDLNAFADSLDGAPWLGGLIAPIVTTRHKSVRDHEIELRPGLLSVFVAEKDHSGRVAVRESAPHVIPLRRDLDALADELGGTAGNITVAEVNGYGHLAVSIGFRGFALQVLAGPNYPFAAPTVLVVVEQGDGGSADADVLRSLLPGATPGEVSALPIRWDLSVDDVARLPGAVRAVRSGPEPPSSRDGIRKRLAGMVSDRLRHKRVLIVGAGSGGSQTADALVRSGVENLVIVDPDKVEAANLSRSVFRAGQIGAAKVDALAEQLRAVNPLVEVDQRTERLEGLGVAGIDELVSAVDLVVAATDDPHTQRLLNHFAYARGVPAIFAGVYAKGVGGEIVVSVPGITRCFLCAKRGDTSRVTDHEPRSNYGNGRLVAEPALGSDILHIVTASAKLAVGLLEIDSPGEDLQARDMLLGALTEGYSYLIMSTVSRFDFFPQVFDGTPSQFAYQSVWLAIREDPACPVCGTTPVDPATTPINRAPQLDQLRQHPPAEALEPDPPDVGREPSDGNRQPAVRPDYGASVGVPARPCQP